MKPNSHLRRLRRSRSKRLPIAIDEIHLNGVLLKEFSTGDLPYSFGGHKGLRLRGKVLLKITFTNSDLVIAEVIPEGYEWDGASIPKLFRWLIGDKLSPEFVLPSMLHDFAIERKLLDHLPESKLLYRALRTRKGEFDIPRWKEYAMFASVLAWSIVS